MKKGLKRFLLVGLALVLGMSMTFTATGTLNAYASNGSGQDTEKQISLDDYHIYGSGDKAPSVGANEPESLAAKTTTPHGAVKKQLQPDKEKRFTK